jgi:hypothetical protein
LQKAVEVGHMKKIKLMALEDPDLERLWKAIGEIRLRTNIDVGQELTQEEAVATILTNETPKTPGSLRVAPLQQRWPRAAGQLRHGGFR